MSTKNSDAGIHVHFITENIEELRKEKGFRYAKGWCEHIGFSVSSYTNYTTPSEKPRIPSVKLLLDIHAVYPEVSLHRLLTKKGPKTIKTDDELEREENKMRDLEENSKENLLLSKQLMKKYIEQEKELEECRAELEKANNLISKMQS